MPSSLIDRSFYSNSRRNSSQVDGLPSGPAETFSTLRMSIFEGLESHPAVDAPHSFLPSSLPLGVEGLIRHPDAPKPFSLVEIFGESMAHCASPRSSSTASDFALALAENSSSLSPKPTSRPASEISEGHVQTGYYDDDEYFAQDYDEDNMADDEYYPSPPPSRLISPASTRTSRFLNASDFTPTIQSSAPSRKSKFLKHPQPEQDSQSSREVVHLHAANPVSSVSPVSPPSTSSVLSTESTTDTSSDSMTEDSDQYEGNVSTSEPESHHHHAFRPSHFLQPLFIPPSTSLKGSVDDGLRSAFYEGSSLVAGLRSALDGAFTGVSSFIGQGVSRFSEISAPSPQPSTWGPSKTATSSLGPPGLISRILFDFFAAREHRTPEA